MVRATTVFLVCAGGLAACGVTPTAQAVPPQAPSTTSVVRSRFAVSIDLDRKGLLVTPPPKRAAPTVTESDAEAMFEATDAVKGPYAFAIFGLGVVTVAARVENPTSPPPPSTGPTTTVPPTTAPPPPTTTATTTTGTVPPPTTAPSSPAPSPLPIYRRRLAWVGIVWGATQTCPGSTTTLPAPPSTTMYVAIVIDARTGHQVLAYTSGGSSPCTGATESPVVTEPNELLSVPWQPVGPASTAVQIQVPACGHYYGWTQVPTTGGGVDDQVVVAVPFDPTCGSAVPQSQSVDQVVPLGSGQVLTGHAPVGPVQALQAPSND